MTRSHHHHGGDQHAIARSWPTRIFAVLTLALPAIFYLLSMSFSLKTIYDPDYAESLVYDDTPAVATHVNSSKPFTQKASPFFYCTPYPAGSSLSDIQNATQTCTREHLWGNTGYAICGASNAASMHICQQRVNSASLYVAGTALVGLALLSSLGALALGIGTALASSTEVSYAAVGHHEHEKGEGHHERAAAAPAASATTTGGTPKSTWVKTLLAFGILLAALAGLCLFVAHYLAFNALVEDQEPSGDASLSNPVSGNTPIQSPWYLSHTGLVYAGMAWLMAGVGVLIASLGGCLGGL